MEEKIPYYFTEDLIGYDVFGVVDHTLKSVNSKTRKRIIETLLVVLNNEILDSDG